MTIIINQNFESIDLTSEKDFYLILDNLKINNIKIKTYNECNSNILSHQTINYLNKCLIIMIKVCLI